MAGGISSHVVWPNYSAENVKAAANKKSSDTLGKDQFLSILVTQLRNQDPMQPLQDKDFIAQMAQFTSVEQLMNMNTELSLLRQSMGSASSLIGKTIEWNEYDEAGKVKLVNGVVDSIISKEGVLYATVGATSVALDYVSSISNGIIDHKPPDEESSESADAAEGAES
jgi:flagellar basal-body rod modification protein FlgD